MAAEKVLANWSLLMIGLFNKSKLIKSSDSIIIQLDSTGYNFKLSFHRLHLILLISSFHHQFIFDSFKASWPFLLINIRIHSSFRLDLASINCAIFWFINFKFLESFIIFLLLYKSWIKANNKTENLKTSRSRLMPFFCTLQQTGQWLDFIFFKSNH